MIEFALVGVAVAGIVALVAWRPEVAVMAVGVFLFVQSAIIRLDAIPPDVGAAVARTDEVVLLVLVFRTAISRIRDRQFSIPAPLWPLIALAVVGTISAITNAVDPLPAAIGLYLSLKAGLWLFVAVNLRIERRTLVLYGYLIGGLFMGVVLVAIAQFAGVSMPWETHTRPSGEIAATSIWNQHTVFGSALSVAVALAAFALRLPGERIAGAVLAIAGGTGILLSSVRRLLLSLPIAALLTVRVLPPGERLAVRRSLLAMRRPAVLGALMLGLLAFAVVVGPRLAGLAVNGWDQYVVDLASRDRYQLYEGAVQLLADSPLLGRGPGTYGSYATVLFDSPAYAEVGVFLRDELKMGAPYASLMGEFGLYGVISFAAFIVLLIRELIPIARGFSGSVQAALASAGIFMLVDMSIESMVHVTFVNSFIGFFAFVGIGAAMRLSAVGGEQGAWEPESLSRRSRGGALLTALVLVAAVVGAGVLLG